MIVQQPNKFNKEALHINIPVEYIRSARIAKGTHLIYVINADGSLTIRPKGV